MMMNGRDRGSASRGPDASIKDLLAVVVGSCRLEILCRLSLRSCSVSGLAEAMGLDVATVSHHLRILFVHGIVDRQSRGTMRMYSLSQGINARMKPNGIVCVEILGCEDERATIEYRIEHELMAEMCKSVALNVVTIKRSVSATK